MTWFLIGALTVGCYFFKASGVLAAGNLRLSSNGESALSYLTPAVLSGLIMVQTFDGGGTLEIGAITIGVVVGAIAACAKTPFPLVLVLASVATAITRLL
jgi:branched-subunit amino acid transport protein